MFVFNEYRWRGGFERKRKCLDPRFDEATSVKGFTTQKKSHDLPKTTKEVSHIPQQRSIQETDKPYPPIAKEEHIQDKVDFQKIFYSLKESRIARCIAHLYSSIEPKLPIPCPQNLLEF